jgi:C4-dicarboxylate-binding protein DctP
MRSPFTRSASLQRRQVVLRAAAACLPLPAWAAGKPLRVRLAHVVAEDTPKGLAAQRFQALVMQRSEGRIAVEVYPEARLYGDRDEVDALRSGAVELLAPSLSKFSRIGFPEFEVFDLPYLFRAFEDVHRVTNGPLGLRLLDGLKRQGLVGLGFLDSGFKHMSATRALHVPRDFAGLRMRVQQGSEVIAAQMRALGAYPVALPFSATREALARGIVQGTENPLSNFWTQGMYMVQPHLSLTAHGYLGYAIVTSERFWVSLSHGDRELLQSCMQEAIDYGQLIAGTQDSQALVQLRGTGRTQIHTPTPTQLARLEDTTAPVYELLSRRIGARWVNDVRDAARSPA